MTEWFMCIYSRSLPWASVLRVWDMFLCEGEGSGGSDFWLILRCVLNLIDVDPNQA